MLNPILPPNQTEQQFSTQLQREYLMSMAHAAKRNIELAYRSLAYLREQAMLIKAHDPEAEIHHRSLRTAMAELEASRDILASLFQLFGIEIAEEVDA